MSAEFLLKTAAVLDAAAAALDAQEAKVQHAVKLARDTSLQALTDQYSSLTGEDLPADVAEKLASSDPSVLGAVKAVFEKTAGSVESMGGSSKQRADNASKPSTRKEAGAAAWDRFGSFINS